MQIIAYSLCCEPYFLELMRNQSEVLRFEFRKPWLACLHLPYRYAVYKDYSVSTISCFNPDISDLTTGMGNDVVQKPCHGR